jgi:hypothetical protein
MLFEIGGNECSSERDDRGIPVLHPDAALSNPSVSPRMCGFSESCWNSVVDSVLLQFLLMDPKSHEILPELIRGVIVDHVCNDAA